MTAAPMRPASWRAFLELVRPPNVATALGDVLAGFAVAGVVSWRPLPWLLLATACLYAGGVAFNDVCDRQIDLEERPERPLPSGRLSVAAANALVAALLTAGVASAAMAGPLAGSMSLAIVALVVVYDAVLKRNPILGPVNMGLCRGANLLLGATAGSAALAAASGPALLVTTYVVAVTILSRGEVLGGARGASTLALSLVVAVLLGLTVLSLSGRTLLSITGSLALTAWLASRVVPPFVAARRTLEPGAIRRAVKTGVLSLALADAVIAASYAGMIYSLALLATAFLAGRLARVFAVT